MSVQTDWKWERRGCGGSCGGGPVTSLSCLYNSYNCIDNISGNWGLLVELLLTRTNASHFVFCPSALRSFSYYIFVPFVFCWPRRAERGTEDLVNLSLTAFQKRANEPRRSFAGKRPDLIKKNLHPDAALFFCWGGEICHHTLHYLIQ